MHRIFCNQVSALCTVTLAFVWAGTGCNHQPGDPQIAQQVQSQISGDSALQGQPITVGVSNGVVTLSGSVSGQGSRELAANDAAHVAGVKTVINNLSTDGSGGAPQSSYANQPAPGTPSYSTQQPPSADASAPQSFTLPAGTAIRIQLGQTLSTKDSRIGQNFSGTVADPVMVNGQTVIRAGAPASGTVTDVKDIGHFAGQAELAVRLDSVRADGHIYPVQSSQVDRFEKGKGKRTAIITGGGAGLGALIGGLTGGGKGALIGGLLGAGAGGAGSAFTGNKDLVLPAESVLTFRLMQPVQMQ